MMQNPIQATQLTIEERTILRLVRQGCRDREIAGSLSLPVDAVVGQVRTICTKVEAHDRLELAAFAWRMEAS
jgi:DNA-binding NarL/FixJ family response regulator